MKTNPANLYLILSLLLSFLVTDLHAQNKAWQENLSDNLEKQLASFPQEKIYAHIDKYFYMPNDTLWFALYLVDAATHQPLDSEQAIYVELIDKKENVAARVKIISDENFQYYGYIPLIEEYGSGSFMLRAYAPYMVSSDESYFFKRNIFIAGEQQEMITANSQLDYEVGFFPEGGQLLSGTPCLMAFKALNEKGLGEQITGEVVDEEGTVVSTFKSNHLGMGVFTLTAREGKSYYARCQSKGKEEKEFRLPEAVDNQYSLHARWMNDRLIISVKQAEGMSGTTRDLYLLLHSRGVVQSISPWDHSKEFVAFQKGLFPAGILQAVLLDEDKNILSERLLFCMNENDLAKAAVSMNKESYSKREHIMSEVALTDREGKPLNGRFSVSVTDDNSTYIDTTLTIVSSLLLDSEIKGYIEEPAYYFQKGNRQAAIELDYLMMTQGWRRYDIAAVAKGEIEHPYVDWDGGQYISGRILGGFNSSPADGVSINAISFANNYFSVAESDKDGKFSFELPHMPYGTPVNLQAKTNRKFRELEIMTDSTVYPEVAGRLPVKPLTAIRMEDDDIRNIQLGTIDVRARRPRKDPPRSVYTKLASHVITEEEIDKKPMLSWSSILQSVPGLSVDRVPLRPGDPRSPIVTRILLRNNMKVSDGGSYAKVMVNDIFVNQDYVLDDIQLYDIAQVDIFKGARAAAFGFDGFNGVVSIMTKSADTYKPPKDNSSVTKAVLPLGYQEPVEFYSPQYTATGDASKADLRRTIYWKPNLYTDKNGKASFSFFSADAPSTYTVIIEGIDNEGKIIRSVSTIDCNK